MPDATSSDAAQWALVSANVILDQHNCAWLMQYPHQALAGGSMYAVLMPALIPPAGATEGPPLPADRRLFLGGAAGIDLRALFLGVIRHPETIPDVMRKMTANFAQQTGKRTP